MTQVLYHPDAEAAVLGSALMRPDALGEVAGWLQPADFFLQEHALIYRAMLDLHEARTPVDLRTVLARLRGLGELERVGGLPAFMALSDNVPTSYHVAHYGRIVQRAAILRRLVDAGSRITQIGHEIPEVDLALAAASAALGELERAAAATTAAAPVALDDLMDQEHEPVRWIVPGLVPAGLTLVCGKPKLGKSWMTLGFGLAVAAGGRVLGGLEVEQSEVLYLALEDNTRRLRSRALKVLAGAGRRGLPFWSATEWPRLDAGGLGRLRAWLDEHPACSMVVVDTIGLVRSAARRGEQQYDADYRAMRELKALADERQIAIVGVHHRTKAETEDAIDSVAGSTGLTGAVDGFLVLSRQRGSVDASLFVTGRDIETEQELALIWDSVQAQWTSAGDAAEYRLSQERQEIMDALTEAGEALYPRQISDMTGQRSNNIYQLLRRMSAEGQIERGRDGRYSLPGAEHDRALDQDHATQGTARRTSKRSTAESDQHDRHDPLNDPDGAIMPIMDHARPRLAPRHGRALVLDQDPDTRYSLVDWTEAAQLLAAGTPDAVTRLSSLCMRWGAPLSGVLKRLAAEGSKTA